MAYNYDEQTSTNNFLIPFTIASDCPQENCEIIYRIITNLKNNLCENCEIIYRIITNLKNNLCKETKHIQQININRNHLVHYLPVIILDRDQDNKHYTFTLTDEKGNKKIFFNFQNETTLSDMLKIFLKRHEELQDKTKLTAITYTTYETLRNTAGYLNKHRQQIQSVNDRLRLDIKNYNNWIVSPSYWSGFGLIRGQFGLDGLITVFIVWTMVWVRYDQRSIRSGRSDHSLYSLDHGLGSV